MKDCTHCGEELCDEVVICPVCEAEDVSETSLAKNMKTFLSKPIISKILLIIGCILLIVGVFAAILFHRPNLRINDFKLHKTPVGAIVQYGIPTGIDDDGDLRWTDCGIEFYGIPVYSLHWDAEDYSLSMSVSSENTDDLKFILYNYLDDHWFNLGYLVGDNDNKDLRLSCPYVYNECHLWVTSIDK